MAKKSPDNAAAAQNVQDLANKATPINDFTNVWIGSAPESLGLDPSSKEKIELDSLVSQDIVVLGYSKRKGDSGPFVICTFVEEGGNQAKVFVTGATVIVRKLDEVAEKNGFPVSGKIIKNPSSKVKGGHYYDFR
jgi:hypothetical protein